MFCQTLPEFSLLSYIRHRPAIGELLAAFAGAFPVAFLEPHLNKHNGSSLLGQLELKGANREGAGQYKHRARTRSLLYVMNVVKAAV